MEEGGRISSLNVKRLSVEILLSLPPFDKSRCRFFFLNFYPSLNHRCWRDEILLSFIRYGGDKLDSFATLKLFIWAKFCLKSFFFKCVAHIRSLMSSQREMGSNGTVVTRTDCNMNPEIKASLRKSYYLCGHSREKKKITSSIFIRFLMATIRSLSLWWRDVCSVTLISYIFLEKIYVVSVLTNYLWCQVCKILTANLRSYWDHFF